MKIFRLNYLLVLMMALAFTACDDDQDNPIIPDFDESELIIKEKENVTVAEEFDRIAAAVDEADLMTVAKVDHAMAAQNANLELRPTQLLIFGNPAAGTQLMQSDQRIGIDLPLKMLVWEDEEGETNVSYYNASTLTDRYAIDDKNEVVEMVNMALENFSGGEMADTPDEIDPIVDDMIVKISEQSADDTFADLVAAIESNDALNIIAQVKHDEAAANVDLDLRPTRLVIFGNPAVGTTFMQRNRNIAIDLPMKMLVWEDEDGSVKIGYYNATTLLDRHDIILENDNEDKVNTLLDELSNAAMND